MGTTTAVVISAALVAISVAELVGTISGVGCPVGSSSSMVGDAVGSAAISVGSDVSALVGAITGALVGSGVSGASMHFTLPSPSQTNPVQQEAGRSLRVAPHSCDRPPEAAHELSSTAGSETGSTPGAGTTHLTPSSASWHTRPSQHEEGKSLRVAPHC